MFFITLLIIASLSFNATSGFSLNFGFSSSKPTIPSDWKEKALATLQELSHDGTIGELPPVPDDVKTRKGFNTFLKLVEADDSLSEDLASWCEDTYDETMSLRACLRRSTSKDRFDEIADPTSWTATITSSTKSMYNKVASKLSGVNSYIPIYNITALTRCVFITEDGDINTFTLALRPHICVARPIYEEEMKDGEYAILDAETRIPIGKKGERATWYGLKESAPDYYRPPLRIGGSKSEVFAVAMTAEDHSFVGLGARTPEGFVFSKHVHDVSRYVSYDGKLVDVASIPVSCVGDICKQKGTSFAKCGQRLNLYKELNGEMFYYKAPVTSREFEKLGDNLITHIQVSGSEDSQGDSGKPIVNSDGKLCAIHSYGTFGSRGYISLE